MRLLRTAAVIGLSGVASSAIAAPVLQFDLNGFTAQAQNAVGVNSAFGGLSHTGRVRISLGGGLLAGMFVQDVLGSTPANMGFNGALASFDGEIMLSNGQVTGGMMSLRLTNGDMFTSQIAPDSGRVSGFIGGGFTIQALTHNGFFTGPQFGNVNVGPWFTSQNGQGLSGSFLQFRFMPNGSGSAVADMDWFVDAVPLPPAAWAGLAVLGGLAAWRRLSRRQGTED